MSASAYVMLYDKTNLHNDDVMCWFCVSSWSRLMRYVFKHHRDTFQELWKWRCPTRPNSFVEEPREDSSMYVSTRRKLTA